MAKREPAAQSAPAPTDVAPGPAPVDVAAQPAGAPVQAKSDRPRANPVKEDAAAPLVIKWKPPEAEAAAEEAGGDAAPAEAGLETPSVEGEKQEESPETPSEEQAPETDAAAAPPKPAEPSKARKILQRIAAEKAKLDAEQVAARERQRAEAAEQALQKYSKGSLGSRLAALGITTEEQRQELAEAILLGKDVVLPEAPEPVPTADERVARLERELAEKKQAEQAAQAQARYGQIHSATMTIVGDMDIGVARAVEKIVGARHADGSPAGTHLIVAVAQQLWEQAGKPQNSAPLVRDAAARVIAHYKTQYPELAGVAPAAAAPKRPAMGQRVPPKPGANGAHLPKDRQERDALIKREMGWG